MLRSRTQVLRLYARSLRLARDWLGPDEEKEYIVRESSSLFRRNRNIRDPEVIEAKIFEAESRIELALHYRIPYPRPYHYDRTARTESLAYTESAYMHSQDDYLRDSIRQAKQMRATSAVSPHTVSNSPYDF